MKKTTILYIISYLLLILSYPVYFFVSFPNETDPGTSLFVYTFYNNMVYEILPFIGAIILTFISYLIYFKFLPRKKNNLLLIPAFLNLVCVGFLIFAGFFL